MLVLQPLEQDFFYPLRFAESKGDGLLLSYVDRKISQVLSLVQPSPDLLPTYYFVNLVFNPKYATFLLLSYCKQLSNSDPKTGPPYPLSLSKLPPGGKGRFNLLAMATVRVLSFTFLFGVLLVQQCICTDAPASSPTPAPESGADVPSPSVTPAPSPSSNLTSPPAPPLSDFPPAPSPVNATSKESPSPAPTPAPNSDVASDISHASTEESKESAGGGMTSGKKAGIAVGVIAAVCFVGLGALVYKKRQQNIQRSQFGYDARREIL
ncbi:putative protein disulfide isomerase-like 1-4-like [Capsicum annuum]|nr:putative protein disulfide isomerase-like 1-4-like [Capsicum annuum]KAF3643728.1 putative protein disulfide isomerase-like 1-4-like [Capsicum annuum]